MSISYAEGLSPAPTSFEEQTRFQALVENISDVIVLLDREWRVVYASPSIRRVLGYTPNDRLGRSAFELLAPDQREPAQALVTELIKRPGESHLFDAKLRHADGSWRWAETAITNLLDDPAVGAVVINYRDVTERKRAADALAASEQQFRAFFEMVGVGNAETEPHTGRFLRVNRKLCEITGYSEQELRNMSFRDLSHPDDREAGWVEWERCVRGEISEYTAEKRYLRKNGSAVWVQITATITRDSQGTPLRGIAVIRDITDRWRAVQALQNSRRDLERRVERRTMELATANQALETLIAASPLGIVSVDLEGQVRRWNPAAERLFGWSETEVLGRPMPNIPDEEHDGVAAELAIDLKNPPVGPIETRRLRRDGSLMDVSIWYAPLSRADGLLTGTMAILMDITERKRLERALLEAGEREQRRIGQDLHDHLCQHLLGVACVLKALAVNADQKLPIEPTSLHRAAGLVNDAVQQARDIARGLHPVELDAEGLMSALRELAERTSASIACELDCDHPVLVSDPRAAMHIYRIAQEAVTNALRHSEATEIRIELLERDDRVLLTVTDNGIGLLPEWKPRESMGLDIMKYRAHAIGGSLKLETPPAGGTRVTCAISTPK